MKLLMRTWTWLIILLVLVPSVVVLFLNKQKNDQAPTITPEPLHYSTSIPQPRGERLLGMGISEGSIGFAEAFSVAQSVGVSVIELPVLWDEYEPRPKEYVDHWLSVANGFYPNAHTMVALSLSPIDTNQERLPTDLKQTSFDSPDVIERYKSFVSFAADQTSESDILFVSIGNEIDIYLGDSDKLWAEYSAFYKAVSPHVKAAFPHAVVGAKMSFSGMMNQQDRVKQMTEDSDVLLVTYYPFKAGGFIVEDPTTVHRDFKRITELYPDKKIYFTEIGYPSGTANGSSEALQAEFIHEAFSAWDTYASRIPYLHFDWLHDQSPESVEEFEQYYGIQDSTFSSFLGTLGLRTYAGKDKAAFSEFRKAIHDRGW